METNTCPVSGTEPAPHLIRGHDLSGERAGVYSRPAARFDEDGCLEVRASAANGCRRALWYTATGHRPSTTPTGESLTVMEAGTALEPVVLRAMERAGWEVTPADPHDPEQVSVRVAPGLRVTGHPGATGSMPLSRGESVIEVKTRGPAAFRRWQALGAERSHPGSVVQAALYTYGTYGEARDAVVATMDTGSRAWDHEVIPADRVEAEMEAARARLGELAGHYALHGVDPDTLPERDFSSGSRQCRGCPFLDTCLPGVEQGGDTDKATEEEREVSLEEAREAVAAYAAARETTREPERAKRAALDTLKAWMRRQGDSKTTVEGRTVSLVQSKRYSVNYRKLNALLDPDVRAEIVTESESEYVRVS